MSRHYRIGEVRTLLGLSADTLRYYEKIGLLPAVNRTPSGIRLYSKLDLSRLRFIRRTQAMNFSLEEIAQLLAMRDDPRGVRDEVRRLTASKLEQVTARLEELTTLRNELTLLINLCRGAGEGCPIIEEIDGREGDG